MGLLCFLRSSAFQRCCCFISKFVLSAHISENQRADFLEAFHERLYSRRGFNSQRTQGHWAIFTGDQGQRISFYLRAGAFDPTTGNLIEGGIEAQTEQVLKNLSAILQAAGSSWEKVVKTTVFLKSMSEFGQMNEVYGKTCKNAPPARSTVEVARLPKDVSVEIDVIALA